VATIPGARSLHRGPSINRSPPSAIDVLTSEGDLVRLTRDPEFLAYSARRVYDRGDALDHAWTPDGIGLLTEEGEVVLDTAEGFRTLARCPGGRRLVWGGEAFYVLVGEEAILRVPGPGLAETYYRSPVPITALAASPRGVFFVAGRSLYFAGRPGEAHQILAAGPEDAPIEALLYGDANNNRRSRATGRFAEAGLSTHPYVRGWLYVVRRGGRVSYVDWSGEEHLVVEGVREFPGYSASDFNYYTFVDAEGSVRRPDFGLRGRVPGDRIRDPDPAHRQYLSFELTRCVLRAGGEVLVADEKRFGSKPPPPARAPDARPLDSP